MKLTDLKPFKGIPNALDFRIYSDIYYSRILDQIKEEYGESATTLDANQVMNTHGNVDYFKWFPDLYGQTEEELGSFYQPSFSYVSNNMYADFIHGLTHIRSRSAHTSMGEAMLLPDNFIAIGVPFNRYVRNNLDKELTECTQTIADEYNFNKRVLPHRRVVLNRVKIGTSRYISPEEVGYAQTYKPSVIKADLPNAPISDNFLITPANPFEQRLSSNVIRAIYMDEKFKMYSSLKKPFAHTPVSIAATEKYDIIFASEEEENWILKLSSIMINSRRKDRIRELLNTSSTKDSYARKIAYATIIEANSLRMIPTPNQSR